MNDLRIGQNLTSLEVAEFLETQHNVLMKDIRRYDNEISPGNSITTANFWKESTYKDKNNQTRPMYLISKQGCEFLGNKKRGVKGTRFTAMYVSRFNEMEQQQPVQQPNELSLEEMTVMVINGQQAKIEELKIENKQLTDRKDQLTKNLKAYEKYGDNLLVREFVKMVREKDHIEISEKEMWKLLDNRYLIVNYRKGKKVRDYKAQYKEYFVKIPRLYEEKVTYTIKITPRGQLYFTNKLNEMLEAE